MTAGHGTPEGYHEGCRTRPGCPAPICCRDVYIRYQGDLTFRKAFDAGTPLTDILNADAVAAEADLIAEKEERLAVRRAAHALKIRRRQHSSHTHVRPWTPEDDAALHAATTAGMSRKSAAEEMGRSQRSVSRHAVRLGLTFPDGRAHRTIPRGAANA